MPIDEDDSLPARGLLLQISARTAFMAPDALMALLLGLAARYTFLPREDLSFLLIAEGAFLMMQGTLVDIATRLRKRPPIWLVPIIAGAVLLFSDHARQLVVFAWQRGMVVFAPLLFSLVHRAMILWSMPNRSRIEKIAARALIANRITTGLGALAVVTLLVIAGMVFPGRFDQLGGSWGPLAAGSLYFAIAAFDDWRVRGPKFAEKPTVLFRFDPIGLTYLEPV